MQLGKQITINNMYKKYSSKKFPIINNIYNNNLSKRLLIINNISIIMT